MWESRGQEPLGTVRRFTDAEGPGWGFAKSYSSLGPTRDRRESVPVTMWLGAKIPPAPTSEFTIEGVTHVVDEPNFGIPEHLIEGAVRSFAASAGNSDLIPVRWRSAP